MDEETLHTIMNKNNNLRAGVGLKNKHQRIKQICGTGITIQSAVNEGTTISFRIPKDN